MEDELTISKKKVDTLCSSYSIIIESILKNPHQFNNQTLQEISAISLCKYMLCSSVYSQKNLSLFFTLLLTSSNHSIRINLLIALGDLMFTYPNLIEPWSNEIFSLLSSSNLILKKSSLMVFMHLILNDMLKSKVIIIEMVKLLSDENKEIKQLAHIFSRISFKR